MTAVYVVLAAITGVAAWGWCWATCIRLADLVGRQYDTDRRIRRRFVGACAGVAGPIVLLYLTGWWLVDGTSSGRIARYMHPVDTRRDQHRKRAEQLKREADHIRELHELSTDPAERKLLKSVFNSLRDQALDEARKAS
ncbi:MAG: hypothetical protein QM582_10120 [Micropruina sp.]|uniref:hypothetical protein n=1 Tax=Micropruina sp. TaxID=2737536 RepID=UPI0039E2282F